MAMNPDIFSDITLASRRIAKCDAIAESVKQRTGVTIKTAEVDADDVAATAALIERVQPKLVVNLALPYQDLSIMEACLKTGVHYMDTANYEPRDEAKRSEEHTSELKSLMRTSYAVLCLKKKN